MSFISGYQSGAPVGTESERNMLLKSTVDMPSGTTPRRAIGPRHFSAVLTLCLFLLAVSGLSVHMQVNGTFGFGQGEAGQGGNLCDFKQLREQLWMRHAGEGLGSALDASELGDVQSADGLFFTAPGKSLPFSKAGQGFTCDARYDSWLKNSALYTPDNCQLLTPSSTEFPFKPNEKVLFAGNSYMFQQITALSSQYFDLIDHERSPSMISYWPSLSNEKRCACVGDNVASDPGRKAACVGMFHRSNWERADGTASAITSDNDFSSGDGFFAGMTGPPATMGITRFQNGAELYTVSNHPLMNSDIFGLEAIAKAFELDLASLDAIYLNEGNYKGFGKLFCGGEISNEIVQNDVAEMSYAHIKQVLTNKGFHGKLLLTGRQTKDDVSSVFKNAVQQSANAELNWPTILVPFHMQLNAKFSPYVAGDMMDYCSGEPTCERKTCEVHNLQGCTGGDGHACTPGFPDVSVNMFLHALRMDVPQYYKQGWH